ncbi:MAG: 1-deoxy-D-xylulose-5-phosphate reductoisomerase [Candidatus Omnitrophota bacterium]|nr:1-deoxy-D-xylulose-5-phosphate reductoisomerase [Candidatus Omnitrophota bacterium]
MKKVAILGSTGSIGVNCLDVISQFPKKFSVAGLSAYNNVDLLESQAKRFKPAFVALQTKNVLSLRRRLNNGIKILDLEKISEIFYYKDIDIIVLGISGGAALIPLWEAVKAGKTIALANKEAFVMAGSLIMDLAKKTSAKIIPVDSEQSAIFQCLNGQDVKTLNKIYLTASGGSLKSVPKERFSRLSVDDVLKHPRWKMGRKITVDCATLMNKGLEIIEAMWLFNVGAKSIEVVIHKEAIIHSMVEFVDGTILAQLGITDMRLPIQYALTYPERLSSNLSQIDFYKLKQLSFERPNLNKFPCLALAYTAAKDCGTSPCVLNAANEISVKAFLDGRIKFNKIPHIIEQVLSKHKRIINPSLEEIILSDKWAREEAESLITTYK